MRIAKINTIVKCPVNKLFAVENTYYGNNKTDRQVITNNKLPLRLTLIKCHISTLSQLRKFNCVTFIAERLIFAFPSTPFDIPDTKKRKLRCKSAWEIKERLIIILKGFIKQPVIKKGSTFLSFSFLIDCYMSVFSLSLSKR